jgi:hypothetical protein
MNKFRMTDTTGSLALITCVKLPPPFWNIAHTAQACPKAFRHARKLVLIDN